MNTSDQHWFLYLNRIHVYTGFTTITSTAILFGKTTLNMQPSALILIGVLTPTSGILGSLAWPFLQRKLQWSNLKVIVVLVLMASAIPAYGCLGFLSIFEGRFGGLTTQGEMFGLAIYFGKIFLYLFDGDDDLRCRICVWCFSRLCTRFLCRTSTPG